MGAPYTVIIPARISSTRLIAKPLQIIAGKTMIQHVWNRACSSKAQRVVIATDHSLIIKECNKFGAEAILTSESHLSGTERLTEACTVLDLDTDSIVVNLQGDEPLIPPNLIDQVANNLDICTQAEMATLACPILDATELIDYNVVKVVRDMNKLALMFSRSVLPALDIRNGTKKEELKKIPYLRHIGIYAYRVNFLNDFIRWGPCWIEQVESLEQLRALWNQRKIHVDDVFEKLHPGVDTLENLLEVRKILEK